MNDLKLTTYDLIDRLNLLISSSRSVPLSNRLLIDKSDISDLADQMASGIPADVKTARQVLDEKDKILAGSQREADETVRSARQTARDTVDAADHQAQQTIADAQNALADAQKRAEEIIRAANDQAGALIADAQRQHSAILQDAQTRANQMVSESEITTRAQAEAQEILEITHQQCDEYSRRVTGAVAQMLEQADIGIARQLDELRALRQSLIAEQ